MLNKCERQRTLPAGQCVENAWERDLARQIDDGKRSCALVVLSQQSLRNPERHVRQYVSTSKQSIAYVVVA